MTDKKLRNPISHILSQVHPESKISLESKDKLASLAFLFVCDIITRAIELVHLTNKKTLNAKSCQTALNVVLPSELVKFAISNATKSLVLFNLSKETPKSGGMNKTSNLTLHPSIIKNIASVRVPCSYRVSNGFAVFLAASTQYIIAEILELSGNASRDSKRIVIQPEHIEMAIVHDESLAKFARTYKFSFQSHGSLSVEQALLPDADDKKRRSRREKTEDGSTRTIYNPGQMALKEVQKQVKPENWEYTFKPRVFKDILKELASEKGFMDEQDSLSIGEKAGRMLADYCEDVLLETVQTAASIMYETGKTKKRLTVDIMKVSYRAHHKGQHPSENTTTLVGKIKESQIQKILLKRCIVSKAEGVIAFCRLIVHQAIVDVSKHIFAVMELKKSLRVSLELMKTSIYNVKSC